MRTLNSQTQQNVIKSKVFRRTKEDTVRARASARFDSVIAYSFLLSFLSFKCFLHRFATGHVIYFYCCHFFFMAKYFVLFVFYGLSERSKKKRFRFCRLEFYYWKKKENLISFHISMPECTWVIKWGGERHDRWEMESAAAKDATAPDRIALHTHVRHTFRQRRKKPWQTM